MRRTIFLALSLAVGVLGALALARTAQALTVSGSLKVDLGRSSRVFCIAPAPSG
jgi:uncharacterized protein involved in exopolysaccharide biosynthesis